MSHHGKYFPRHPKKYKGNPTNIVYRSSWEKKFMSWCDLTESVSEWQSEEFFIPYRSPIDGRVHRYFPDFFVKYRDANGKRRTMVVEVKPKKETKMPITNPKRRTKSWAYSVRTYAVNQAKWKAAKEFCKDHNYEFKIMTEHELGIR
jgi:hypothetical protein|tara:strand:+ start:15 stop:455 length:441 start_codon:yes stop_codon:yes gene_type:complete